MNDPLLWAKAVGLLLAVAMTTFASSAQTSLFYINRSRLRALISQGTSATEAMRKTVDEPSSGLATSIALNVLAVFFTTAIGLALATDPALPQPASTVVLVAMTLLLLLLAEIVGRALVAASPERVAPQLVRPVQVVGVLLVPVVRPVMILVGWLLRLLKLPRQTLVTEEEVQLLVNPPEGDSVLEQDERDMIHGIIGMSQRPVREVMVPRIDMTALPVDATVGQALDEVVRTGHSRIPLYDASVDDVVGIVYAKDLLRHLKVGAMEDAAAPIARTPHFVPESKKVDELLQEMQQQSVHLAIVVDEYGGTAGLVTIEDLIEEIVGEIRDEYDVDEEAPVERLNDHEAIMDARTTIRDVNELFGLHLEPDEFDTLSGLIYHSLGKMPMVGDQVRVDGCELTVLETTGRRIRKVRVVYGVEDTPSNH